MHIYANIFSTGTTKHNLTAAMITIGIMEFLLGYVNDFQTKIQELKSFYANVQFILHLEHRHKHSKK